MSVQLKNILCTHYLTGKCKFDKSCSKTHAIDIASAKAEYEIKKTAEICDCKVAHDTNKCSKLHLDVDLTKINKLFIDSDLDYIRYKYNDLLMRYNKSSGDEQASLFEEITEIKDYINQLKLAF